MPQPKMTSVFQMQRKHPEGFADMDPTKTLYNPDPDYTATPNQTQRDEGALIYQINFQNERDKPGDRDDWHGQAPGEGWLIDTGEPVGEHQADGRTVRYGWVGGEPFMRGEAHWADPDFRYRTQAHWGHWNAAGEAFSKGRDELLKPFGQWDQVDDPQYKQNADLAWQIALEPGSYNLFIAAGSVRKPERISWPEEYPMPFKQVNAFRVNGRLLEDPGQSDVRRDGFWTQVEIGEDGRLTIKPADQAITPKLAFIQIYRQK
jgi:hypothetical protein